ncbi:hypothetical protein CSOJ01_05074 [Colletotrichum sojae]|uniref:Uncharacterized protein n=1 Tax=Colletotrichum sojae TaxID=2175907 RepID=A0A8H6MY52_9PEZI|nr:hypothetical protein CSOJ01_05074 [Colletotrichum sojae]
MAVWDRQLRDVNMEKGAVSSMGRRRWAGYLRTSISRSRPIGNSGFREVRDRRLRSPSTLPRPPLKQSKGRAHGANGTSIAHYQPTRYDTRRELNRENGPRAYSRLAGWNAEEAEAAVASGSLPVLAVQRSLEAQTGPALRKEAGLGRRPDKVFWLPR